MPDCPNLVPVCWIADNVTDEAADAVGAAAGNAIRQVAEAVQEAVGTTLTSLGTVWVNVGTPNIASDGNEPSDAVGYITGSLAYYTAGLAVLSVIIGGTKMAWEQRGAPGKELLKSLLTLVVVSSCGLALVGLAVAASDELAKAILDNAVDEQDFGKNILTMFGFAGGPSSALGPMLVILLGVLAIFSSFVQIMIMFARAGMLVLLAGILPTAAAATNTEFGRTWFRRLSTWLVAFILYKPAAAIVYATAFRLVGTDVYKGDGLIKALTGLMLMILALVALPAMMRFLTPAVAAVASGGSGAAGLAAGALAALPTGAIKVPPMGGGGKVPQQSPPPNSTSGPNSSSTNAPSGSGGPSGTNGSSGSGGTPGPTGSPGSAGATGAGSTPAAGAAAGGAGAGASGAAAGPVGIGIAAVQKGAQVAQAGINAAKSGAESAAGDGPSGAK